MQMHHELIQLALAAGANKATVIRTEDMVMSSVFRTICASNSCGMYNRCWTCPPFIGDIDELIAQARTYKHGLLYQSIHEIEDSFDIEGMFDAKVKHTQVSQTLSESIKPVLANPLHLSCGGCSLCERCSKLDNQPCRFPDKALASMEGYGIDVYQTVKPTELKYINGQNTVTYFGIVLF